MQIYSHIRILTNTFVIRKYSSLSRGLIVLGLLLGTSGTNVGTGSGAGTLVVGIFGNTGPGALGNTGVRVTGTGSFNSNCDVNCL